MNYYLGVDGGGSKTLAVVSDEAGNILGRGISGCGNHQINQDLADFSIRKAVGDALQAANLSRDDIRFAVFGLAGADREADFRILRPMIAAMDFTNWDIVCDTVIGMRAGTRQPDGVVIICGSGTNCFGINARGQSMQCGGFGYLFGDFGGGGDLSQEVFRTVIRAWEGREEPTLLTELTLRELGYQTVEDMFNHCLDEGRRVPISLAKSLFVAADQADRCALEILQHQGTELGKSASAVIRKLGMEQTNFDLVMVGSILTRGQNEYLLPYIEYQVKQAAPGCTMRVLDMEPVAGAILLAMEHNGIMVEAFVYEKLHHYLSIQRSAVQWEVD
ncbi:ATPase [Paenibacillaceae bacterium]|nr:ATPase [Paenibacillaceae bacterium]